MPLDIIEDFEPKNNLNILSPSFTKDLDPKKAKKEFILDQEKKCRKKLEEGDYDGAISSARTMMESILKELLAGEDIPKKEVNSDKPKRKVNLNKLFTKLRKEYIFLNPGEPDLPGGLQKALSGLCQIVDGLSEAINLTGDRHDRPLEPSKHHALLIVNSAITFCDFLVPEIKYQNKKITDQ